MSPSSPPLRPTNASQTDAPTYAASFVAGTLAYPSTFDYLKYGPFTTADEYISFYNSHIRDSGTTCLLAVLVLPRPVAHKDLESGPPAADERLTVTFAGIAGLVAQPDHATVDFGLILLPSFRRTFVATHALGLLLAHCLDPPENGGLGLRRVQWQCNAANEASVRVAERMGFVREAVVRWKEVLPVGKGGEGGDGMPGEGGGRHTAVLAVCWDDWVREGRELVRARMAR